MMGTPREIALEMFKCSDLDGEKCVFACWSGADIRSICFDADLSDEDVGLVLEKLHAHFECDGYVGPIRGIVDDLLDDKRALRTVTIPATSLEVVMQLAGREMQRIAVCAEDGGGNADDTLKEENNVMLSLRAALDA